MAIFGYHIVMSSERQKIWILFALILSLGFLTGGIAVGKLPAWWPQKPWFEKFTTRLGLDLQGGSHLIYQADTSQVSFQDAELAIAGVRDVIEKRVNALGISEPLVQTAKVGENLRVIVELAGVFDVNEAIKQIGATPLLEFKTEAGPAPKEYPEEEKKKREEFNASQLLKAKGLIKQIHNSKGANFAELAAKLSEDPGSAKQGGDLGFAKKGMFVKEFEEALFDKLKDGEVAAEPALSPFGYHIIQRLESKEEQVAGDEQGIIKNKTELSVRGRHILFKTQPLTPPEQQGENWQNTPLGGKQLTKAEVQFDQTSGVPSVGLNFNDEGAHLFADLTGANVGKRVAIFLDGAMISSPVVQQKIEGGQAVITGNFSIPEARELVQRLNAGALPMPIKLVSQQTVGPSLGAASIQRSLQAGIIGFVVVAGFMILFYRFAGALSVAALLFYAGLVFSLFKLIPVTLTMAGIAGFVLSLGMAVDANVLIFERLREELRRGQPFDRALAEGFARAWHSIRDSNVSSLITCLILAWLGTSVVKGFAITLAVGILASMFTAIIITRLFMMITGSSRWLREKKWVWGG